LLLANDGKGQFHDAGPSGGAFFQRKVNARGSGVLDIDNDGRLDVVLSTLAQRPVLLHNLGGEPHHWLTLKLEGTQSNREGLGAIVEVSLGGSLQRKQARCPTGYVFQEDPRLHFGLGTQQSDVDVRIRWPSGAIQTLTNVQVDTVLEVREPGNSRWGGVSASEGESLP
jgi:hypothetical protein